MQPSTRRLLQAVAVALIALNLVVVGMVAYPLSEMDHRPAAESFEHEGGEQYRVAANVTTDGTTSLAVEGAVTTSGERYVMIQEETVRTEQYQTDSGAVYTRTVVTGEQADRVLEHVRSDPDRELVETSRDGETVTVVSVVDDPEADLADELAGAVSVVTAQLRLASYERVDGTARTPDDVERDSQELRPRNGWYDGSRSYRLTDTSGTVRVESGTNELVSATVQWDLTRNTDTYLHYLLNRRHTVTQRVTYQYETGDVSVETPDWVESVRR
jgi:hypothetical protein